LEDKDAQQKVDTGYWKFIPKSEWKSFKNSQVIETHHDMGGSYEVKVEKKKKSKNFLK
jgi:hypothetical protein